MLTQVAEGVLVHESEFLQSNAVVVHGDSGALLVDPGVLSDELAGISADLDRPVAAGFSTHPHWDHLLWHAAFGAAPRYGTARCAALIQAKLSDPGWEADVAAMLPEDIAGQVPLDDVFGRITGLPAGASRIPWHGPVVRVIEHSAHAPGHAALLIEERGVLVGGDMLSDVLVPMLSFAAEDPIGDYLAALQLIEAAATGVEVLVPGHGSVGDADELRARIDQDRAYLHALRDGRTPDDPRIGPSAKAGWEWVADAHEGQRQHLARTRDRQATA
ncbi:MBL fold metallo-hydrolase [Cellulomonas sp. URHE0023]|uniref:MBL fold metallo-hydrolase n=1 Tax=Cellulomonas sp. URHE0023 TaxID=1380354 RepID=UPI0004871993|nr:MBL fold metallo-hydrolase [Cellulomonas sp. URHE0023]